MRQDEASATSESGTQGSSSKASFISDSTLIAACRRQEIEAWDALIMRYQGLIFGMARKMGLSAVDAEDVFQNVCVILYQNLDKLRDTRRLAGWLSAVTQHEVSLWYRKQNPAVMREVEVSAFHFDTAQPLHQSGGENPEAEFLDWERQHLVEELMNHISPECECLLKMLYGTDPPATYAEVAETLTLPIGSIGPKRARCLQQLRKMLAELGY